VTSVSVGVADELARLQRSTFLIDADPVGGAVAITLGMLQESSGLAIAARRADHGGLDIDGLARTARRIRPGLRVLTGVDAPERGTLLRPAAVATVCRVARTMAQLTVVDAGTAPLVDDGARAAVTRAVLGEADAIVVVGAADPVGMSRLVPAIGHAQGFGIPVHVVVTRLRTGVLGRDGHGQVREALRRHAGCLDVLTVPDDRAVYDEALREGRTVSECAPRSAVRTALIDLAGRLSRIEECLPQTEHPAA
jgi:MinD-like ATPase involved in chromosome partitioning or flagellar assembly